MICFGKLSCRSVSFSWLLGIDIPRLCSRRPWPPWAGWRWTVREKMGRTGPTLAPPAGARPNRDRAQSPENSCTSVRTRLGAPRFPQPSTRSRCPPRQVAPSPRR